MSLILDLSYPINPIIIDILNSMFLTRIEYKVLFPEEVENIETTFQTFRCGICLNNKIKGKKLRCKHTFCEKCIIKWLTEHSNSCPICRTILNS